MKIIRRANIRLRVFSHVKDINGKNYLMSSPEWDRDPKAWIEKDTKIFLQPVYLKTDSLECVYFCGGYLSKYVFDTFIDIIGKIKD